MSASERCPCCNSPDLAPYKFGENTLGAVMAEFYRNARKCMDCGATIANIAEIRAPINFATLKKAT